MPEAQTSAGDFASQNELFPRDPNYAYGNVLPYRVPLGPTGEQAGAAEWDPLSYGLVGNTLNSVYRALMLPQRATLGQVTPTAQNATDAAITMMGSAIPFAPGGSATMGMIKGYHGTPHTFEPVDHNPFGEFRDEAIGSGEGAQVYGWGHYVAGAPGTAKYYQEGLTRGSYPTDNELRQYFTPGAIRPSYGGYDKVLKYYEPGEEGNPYPSSWSVKVQGVNPKTGEVLPGIDGRVRVHTTAPDDEKFAKAGIEREPRGALLHVEIKPDESELLDWDAPLAAQSKSIQNTVTKLLPNLGAPFNRTGEQIYDALTRERDSEQAASQSLHRAGVPGIKYLDQGSRDYHPDVKPFTSGGETQWEVDPKKPDRSGMRTFETKQEADDYAESLRTRNYVIFHPSNLTITGRNGQRLEPVEHDPFGQATKYKIVPIEHDPFQGSSK